MRIYEIPRAIVFLHEFTIQFGLDLQIDKVSFSFYISLDSEFGFKTQQQSGHWPTLLLF